jgi:hypothetical protein
MPDLKTRLQNWTEMGCPKPRSLKEAVELRLEVMECDDWWDVVRSPRIDPMCQFIGPGCRSCPLITVECTNFDGQKILEDVLKEITTN